MGRLASFPGVLPVLDPRVAEVGNARNVRALGGLRSGAGARAPERAAPGALDEPLELVGDAVPPDSVVARLSQGLGMRMGRSIRSPPLELGRSEGGSVATLVECNWVSPPYLDHYMAFSTLLSDAAAYDA